ncbi:MAG: insulinase family protein [Bacteriovoracaceae bacterium]|nr:insulinase family protein [Bacteriovoracaceae bacterium]
MNIKRCLLLVALSIGLTSFSSCTHKSQKVTSIEMTSEKGGIHLDVKKFTLDNGLRLLVYENQKLPIFSFYTFFDIGGRHEGPGTTGATHFLEHMMFKGAKKYGPRQFDTLIEGNGGNTNAYTNFDNTVYYESLPTKSGDMDMVEKIIDMEADRMQHLALEPAAFEKERQVVLEERKMRYENSPQGQVYLTLMKSMFAGTPYGGSVIGEVKDLNSLSRDQVHEYFKKFYTPDNAVIIIAGAVNADDVYENVKKRYGSIKPSQSEVKDYRLSRDDLKLYTHQANYGRHIKLNSVSKTPMFMLGFPGNAIGTKESFVRDILASILGQGESSYLYKNYVTGKTPQLSSISAANYTLKYNGIFWLSGELLKGQNIDRIKSNLLKETKVFCDKAITERTLQKTKNQYLVGYVSEIETNKGVAHFLGMRENFFGDYLFYKKEMEIYNAISVEEVKSTCHDLFKGNNYIMVSTWNKHPKKS